MSAEKNITVVEETAVEETKVTFGEKVQQFKEKNAKVLTIVKIAAVGVATGTVGYLAGKKAGIKSSQVQDIVEIVLEETGDAVQ